MSRSLWRTSWTGVRSPAPGGAGPACGLAAWRATRATAAQRLGAVCDSVASVLSFPARATNAASPHFDRAAYRLRNRVERLINRLKQFRRIATRYEKRAANYLAMLTIGMILLWI